MFTRILKRTLLVAFLVALLWAGGLLWFMAYMPSEPNGDKQPADAIVVLTGGAKRLDRGLQLLAEGKGKKLFISGVGKDATLRDLYKDKPASRYLPYFTDDYYVELGREAHDTKGNAAETARWMHKQNYKSMRLVTANYHMPRSLFELKRAMPDITIIPDPVFPDPAPQPFLDSPETRMLILSEYNKFIIVHLHSVFPIIPIAP